MFNWLKDLFRTDPLVGYAAEIDQAFLDANDKDPIEGNLMRKVIRSPKIGDFMFIATNREMMTFIPRSDFLEYFSRDLTPAAHPMHEEMIEAGYKPVRQIKDL